MSWTPKRAVARSRKNLAAAADRLRAVALEWGDVDQCIVDQAEAMIPMIEDFANQIENDTNARLAAGEHVGL
jgi:hypothetical protein